MHVCTSNKTQQHFFLLSYVQQLFKFSVSYVQLYFNFLFLGLVQKSSSKMAETRAQHGHPEEWLRVTVQRLRVRHAPVPRLHDKLPHVGHENTQPTGREKLPVGLEFLNEPTTTSCDVTAADGFHVSWRRRR